MGRANLTTSDVVDAPELRKARGAFFTPPEVCEFIAAWALRSADDTVLEPSAGEAAFMVAAATRLAALGATNPALDGYELHYESATRAMSLLRDAGFPSADIKVGDFLRAPSSPSYSAVMGNPPYIRYQGFTGEAREAGRLAAQAQGVELTGLASSWAPFVVHAASFLQPLGRLALVLPAELLSSNYAASVREFLLRRFGSVRVILFDKHVFPGVQTEALLLLAEGAGGTNEVAFTRVHRAADLGSAQPALVLHPATPSARWTTALVDADALDTVALLTGAGSIAPLETWGRVNLGAVTGNNRYFTMSPAEAKARRLQPEELVPISPPGSSHLRALSLTRGQWTQLGEAGERTLLFRPGANPSRAALRFIKEGERDGVHEAYKCRVRAPWWRVPVGPPPDLFFTYMNSETTQLCANPLRLLHLNSLHGLYMTPALRRLAPALALASLNSATMLSAEVVGRSYGGGILKMEPREAARLAVPSPQALAPLAPLLSSAVPRVRAMLRRGDLPAAVSEVDELVLVKGLGLDPERVHELRRSRSLLATRRRTRANK